VACGGNSDKKAEDKKGAPEVEQTAEQTAEQHKVVSYMEKLSKAADESEGLEIALEMGLWINSLSEKDAEVEQKAMEEWMKNNPAGAVKVINTLQKVQSAYGDILE
jgi:hypothetical protein